MVRWLGRRLSLRLQAQNLRPTLFGSSVVRETGRHSFTGMTTSSRPAVRSGTQKPCRRRCRSERHHMGGEEGDETLARGVVGA